MNTRTESYLQHMLSNPGVWVHIRKKKKTPTMSCSRQISAERREIYKSILTTLRIMGIGHDKGESGSYKILIQRQ
jgi:hypothetical protein